MATRAEQQQQTQTATQRFISGRGSGRTLQKDLGRTLSLFASRLMQSSLSPYYTWSHGQHGKQRVEASRTHHSTQSTADGIVADAASGAASGLIHVSQADLNGRVVLGMDDPVGRRAARHAVCSSVSVCFQSALTTCAGCRGRPARLDRSPCLLIEEWRTDRTGDRERSWGAAAAAGVERWLPGDDGSTTHTRDRLHIVLMLR